jgi:hypothetical protein
MMQWIAGPTPSAITVRRPFEKLWNAVLLGCLMAAAAPTAVDAQPVHRTVTAGPLYTVADGPLCGGPVNLLAAPRGPETASIQVTGGFFGISGTSAPCSVGVSVHWRNLDTGVGGVEHGRVAGLMIPSSPIQVMHAEIRPGRGVVELRMEPHRPHLPIAPVHLRMD